MIYLRKNNFLLRVMTNDFKYKNVSTNSLIYEYELRKIKKKSIRSISFCFGNIEERNEASERKQNMNESLLISRDKTHCK